MLSRSGVRLIGILSCWEYNDLIGGDADMADLFTRIEIDEPNEEAALAIARQHAARLSQEFGLRIDGRVVERTVALCSTFILSECHPAKSIHILRRVCEDADYDRSQLGQERTEITVEDVVRAIAEKTGIPPHTIAGESDEQDFEAALTAGEYAVCPRDRNPRVTTDLTDAHGSGRWAGPGADGQKFLQKIAKGAKLRLESTAWLEPLLPVRTSVPFSGSGDVADNDVGTDKLQELAA